MKLSRLANTKNNTKASQKRIQNGVMKFRKITVRHIDAINHRIKLKMNGGSKKIN